MSETKRREEPRLLSNLVATRPRRERRSALAAAAGSLGVHGLLLAGLIWLTMSAARPSEPKDDPLVLYTPVPEAPPPPPMAPPPAPPRAPRAVVQLAKTVAAPKPVVSAPAKGFQTLTPPTVTPPDIPPPTTLAATRESDFTGEGEAGGSAHGSSNGAAQKMVTADDISAAPTFTPFTVAPALKNRDEVARALQRDYPDMLRDQGIGGKVLVWFLIDETGKVQKYQIKQSSGHAELDRAALEVAGIMRFSPALNRDRHVPVWVALPIAFQTQAAG